MDQTKLKVFEIARDLSLDPHVIIAYLQKQGYNTITNEKSAVNEEMQAKIISYCNEIKSTNKTDKNPVESQGKITSGLQNNPKITSGYTTTPLSNNTIKITGSGGFDNNNIDYSSDEFSAANTLITRINQSTKQGGLTDVPKEYEPPGYDWESVRNENPFIRLYLDYREKITLDIVKKNHEILRKYWDDRVLLMYKGNKQLILDRHKNRDGQKITEDEIKKFPEIIGSAFHVLNSESGIENQRAKINKKRLEKGKEKLIESITYSLSGGIFSPESCNEIIKKGTALELTHDESIDVIIEKLIEADVRFFLGEEGKTIDLMQKPVGLAQSEWLESKIWKNIKELNKDIETKTKHDETTKIITSEKLKKERSYKNAIELAMKDEILEETEINAIRNLGLLSDISEKQIEEDIERAMIENGAVPENRLIKILSAALSSTNQIIINGSNIGLLEKISLNEPDSKTSIEIWQQLDQFINSNQNIVLPVPEGIMKGDYELVFFSHNSKMIFNHSEKKRDKEIRLSLLIAITIPKKYSVLKYLQWTFGLAMIFGLVRTIMYLFGQDTWYYNQTHRGLISLNEIMHIGNKFWWIVFLGFIAFGVNIYKKHESVRRFLKKGLSLFKT